MKSLLRVVGVGIALTATVLQAQNFNGSDNFSSVSGNWGTDSTASGGLFAVGGGTLNFNDPGVPGGQTSSAARSWILNAGSYTADWQVQVDLSLNLTQVPGQFTKWNLSLQDSANSANYLLAEFSRSYMLGTQFVSGNTYTNSAPDTLQHVDVTGAIVVSVLVSYTSAIQALNIGYDSNGLTGGYVFTNFYSSNIGPGGLAWNMTTGDTFNLQLSASNAASAGTTNAIPALGAVYADNFVATGTPIPEPSAYAAGLGALALGVAVGLRRRRK